MNEFVRATPKIEGDSFGISLNWSLVLRIHPVCFSKIMLAMIFLCSSVFLVSQLLIIFHRPSVSLNFHMFISIRNVLKMVFSTLSHFNGRCGVCLQYNKMLISREREKKSVCVYINTRHASIKCVRLRGELIDQNKID